MFVWRVTVIINRLWQGDDINVCVVSNTVGISSNDDRT